MLDIFSLTSISKLENKHTNKHTHKTLAVQNISIAQLISQLKFA